MFGSKIMISSFNILIFWLCFYVGYATYPSKVAYFDQTIDHFNQMSNGEKTYRQKYLFQDKYWKPNSGPIFFYAGNEGPIQGFWDASGFIHEFAPEMGALVIFVEHRYYGESLPFGDSSFKHPYPGIGLLTIEQAMADYAVFLTNFTTALNATNSKIIAFGGSYGGMLAAYMRFKYPNIIHGSLAASAPLFMQDPTGPRNFFFELVTKDFRDAGETCYNVVKQAFVDMNNMLSDGTNGLSELSQMMGLCHPMKSRSDYDHMLKWARNAFTMMAMLDYPYKADFMGSLPANPVNVACDLLSKAKSPIHGISQAAGVFYNNSLKCFDIYAEFIDCADPTGCGLGNDAAAWDFQACTDVWLPGGTNNVTDMFPVLPWNREMRKNYCQEKYGVTPRTLWPSIQFWGEKIKTATNIIFSNGNLDPWRGGGIVESLSDSLISIPVIGGAHHLDLRGSNKADPTGVLQARQREKDIIKKWLQ